MRRVLTILLLLLLGNACAFAQASSSSVFKDRDNPISASDLQSKVVVKGPKPVAGDIISGVIRDADGPSNAIPVVERDSLNRTLAYSFTDSTGYFSFRLVNPDDRLQAVYIGFYSVNCEFSGSYFYCITANWPVSRKEAGINSTHLILTDTTITLTRLHSFMA